MTTNAQNLAAHYKCRYVEYKDITLQECKDLAEQHHHIKFAEHRLLPIAEDDNQLVVALYSAQQLATLSQLQFQHEKTLAPCFMEEDPHTALIKKCRRHMHYKSVSSNLNETSIIALVNHMIDDAVSQLASDIHIEPQYDHVNIRFRVDGILNSICTLSKNFASPLISRLKILASCDIAQKRLPQDGHFSYVKETRLIRDCRLSTCPVIYGEKAVIRLLNPDKNNRHISDLGFHASQLDPVYSAIRQPQGLILVTGPTGSGKSITLYTLLSMLDKAHKNISTIEQPVEMNIKGINQINVNADIGMSFSEALKTLLRQDPDVIMVGEIRDQETAQIAIKAANTGHLVLATLHTNSSAQTILRLIQMGIPSYQIASSLKLVISQRLLRLRCRHCSIIKKDQPCPHCDNGFSGRTGAYEVMPVTSAIRKVMTQKDIHADAIETMATSEGMLTLYQAGIKHMNLKNTTKTEVLRVLQDSIA
jgi:type IV pilus assembly protein PilB